MASIYVYGISSTSFSVMLTGLQIKDSDGKDITYTRKCVWNIRTKSGNNTMGSDTKFIEPGNTEGGGVDFDDLIANTTYVVTCSVYRTDTGAYLSGFETEVTTPSSGGGGGDDGGDDPDQPIWTDDLIYEGFVTDVFNDGLDLEPYTLYIYAITFANSGVATFYSTGNDDTRAWLTQSPYYDTEDGCPTGDILASNDDYTDHNFYFTYNVLSHTTYYLIVRLFGGGLYGYTDLRVEAPTNQTPKVAKWDWNIVNGSYADEYQAYASHQALLTKGYTTDFSYRVWIDLVDKVVEIQDVKGYGWDITYGRYLQTIMSASDTELTATRFNSLRNNLEIVGQALGLSKIPDTLNHDNAPAGTIPHPVESDEPVFAHYFFTLANYINDCIDLL